MNIFQSIKMAWRSIKGKKGRSVLTVLSIFIGIASVMTIVSVMEGMKEFTRQQYASMGTNKISVSLYSWYWDETGESVTKDYFPEMYEFCNMHKDCILGISPNGYLNANVVYGTKSSANMEYQYDDNWNLISAPPSMYYGSDQYAVCNNLKIVRGRDIAYLDCANYNQVLVLGSQAAELFFGKANPVGKEMQVNGQAFTVIGVYGPRIEKSSSATGMNSNMDNIIIFPYTARRVLGGEVNNQFYVKATDSDKLSDAMSEISAFLKGITSGKQMGYDVYSESSWQQYEDEQMTMIGLVLGGIAAISLLVGGIGIMNIMLVSVTERTKEIGIRRAIGAQRSTIVAQFLIEAGMLCGIGGLVGIIFGTVGSIILGKLIYQMVIWPSPAVTLGAFALSVGLGILFGSYPASRASKLQPVEALRTE